MNLVKTEVPANILVVDDDLNNLRLLTDVLTRQGYDVRPIRNGQMALAAVEAKQPDLILLDIMMPSMNGYEVCSRLKENEESRHIPVIFLSALNETDDKVKGFSIGAADYISKPFYTDEVIARIENQLQMLRLQKQLKTQNDLLQKEIKERLLMEEKLRSSQDEIRGFFEAMVDIVLMVDAEGKLIKVAPTNPHKFYSTEIDIIGHTIDIFFGESAEKFLYYIKLSLLSQKLVNCEYSLKIGTEELWFFASIAPTSENTVAWVARDITARKKAEDELRLLLETTQAISNSTGVNSALEKILELICRAIDWDFAEAWLPSENGENLEPSWGWYGRDSSLEEFRIQSKNITLAPNQGLAGKIWKSGKCEWIENLNETDETSFLRKDLAFKVGLKTACAVPVIKDNKVLVILIFFKRNFMAKNQRLLDLVTAIATMISSMMAQKQAETALTISEERLHLALEGSSLGLWDWDLTTDKMYWDRALKAILGYEENEIKENLDVFKTLLHPEDLLLFQNALNGYLQGKINCYEVEFRLRSKSGEWKWILCRGKVSERDINGKPVRITGTNKDITEQKKVEETLRISEERWQFAIEGSGDGIWDWNLQTNEVFYSKRWKEMLGYEDFEISSRLSEWDRLVHPDDRNTVYQSLDRHIQGETLFYINEQRLRCKDGSYKWILDRGKIIDRTDEGQPLRIIGTHSDITERKNAEEALQKAVLAADAANRAKSEFLAAMSHELRTPLNAILGFSQLMSYDNSISYEHQKNLGIINRAGEHLLSLIDDILEVSKIEAGRINFNENSFNLLQLLKNLEQMLQLKAAAKGLYLVFEYGMGIPEYVKTDEGKLRQVLLNLLSNAIKFTNYGHVILRVALSCDTEDKTSITQSENLKLYFEIEDTGPGIDPKEIHLLFEPFGQTETGRKSQQGTGLGLPISQKYVQLMGGKITVNSTVGQGSIFSFNISITLANTELIASSSFNPKVIGLVKNENKYRILIVDDVADSRLLLNKILVPIGFAVRAAENGKEAVEIWQEWQPHLILMDIRMPVMDGYEAIKIIRNLEEKNYNLNKNQTTDSCTKTPFKTLIIALTASAFEEERKTILDVGCDDFVPKPFPLEILLKKISEVLAVEYVWENNPKDAEMKLNYNCQLGDDEALNSLSEMPSEWLAELESAASECSDDIVLELLETIPKEKRSLADTIRNLADNFQFDKIITLTQKARK
ncbi:MAG TPA: response regulator [Halomicronema sp.]